ncbi:hypothetical protein UFOVP1356_15 [uncultured Caudovirales phage]|uniref:Uncharacterized protein n=1 Tax=uncultured Caudovirales phage TaxID=2100421 RepID=A0A6J5S0T7_9CAUD|nr:hypothetical protein UFOVP1356_15 [uncultured Caudovirales phage]
MIDPQDTPIEAVAALTPAAADNVWKRSTYTPGDGDVIRTMRPGSLTALEVPSIFGNERRFRDGRTEARE